MAKTLYGDAVIALKIKVIDYGCLGYMHDVYDYAVAHGAKPLKNNHPLNVFQRVLNALDRDERFSKRYVSYSGIIKKPVRSFRSIE